MTSPVHESADRGYVHGFADPIGTVRAAQLAAVEHPRWCDRTRCDARVGGRHIGYPFYWPALGDDVEFSLSKLKRDGDPAGYLLGTRRTSEVEVFETELREGDFEAALTARMRVHLAVQEIEGDPRDDAEFDTDEATFDAMMAGGEPAEIAPDIADTAELPIVEARSEEPAV